MEQKDTVRVKLCDGKRRRKYTQEEETGEEDEAESETAATHRTEAKDCKGRWDYVWEAEKSQANGGGGRGSAAGAQSKEPEAEKTLYLIDVRKKNIF